MKLSVLLALPLLAWCADAQVPSPAPTSGHPTVTLTPMPAEKAPVLPADQVVLTIGDRKITYAQFIQMANSMPEQSREGAQGAQRTQFANFLVQMISLSQEAKRQKIDETPAYKSALSFQLDNTLAGVEFEQIGKDATPDEAALRKYYDDHKAEYMQLKARHILIRFKGAPVPVREGQSDIGEADALTKALELRKRIVGGEDFATLAKSESDDTSSGANGGDLGTFGHGQMVPAFEEAAFALEPGQVSNPVKSQFGYHLIKLESKEAKPFADVRATIENQLKQAKVQSTVNEVVKKAAAVLDPAFFPAPPAVK